MTEQNVDGVRDGDSAAQNPNSSASPSQEASTIEALQKRLDALEKRDRDLQGKLDKDANAIEKRLASNFDARLQELGVTLTPEQKTKKEIQDLREQLASVGQGAAKPQPQTVADPQTPVDITKIKQAYNDIDFNNPVVLKAVSENLHNEDGLLTALGKIKVSGLNKPQPTAASVATPSGSASTSNDMTSLQAEYDRLVNDTANFKKNKAARQEILQKMQDIEKA